MSKVSKPPCAKRSWRLLVGIWRNHQNRLTDLEGELEELAVGLLLEMPKAKFEPEVLQMLRVHAILGANVEQRWLSVLSVELISLRKDPRVLVTTEFGAFDFCDFPLEDREFIVTKLIEWLKEERDAKEA